MARANLLGLSGAILSILSIAMVWFFWLFSSVGSSETELNVTLDSYCSDLALIFIVGAFAAFLTPLGAILQLPALAFFPFMIWYRHAYAWEVGYAVALIGAALSISSIFAQLVPPGIHFRMPPEWRTRVWSFGKEHLERPLPRVAKTVLVLSVVAAVLISASIMIPAYTHPKSKLSISVWVDGSGFDVDNVTIKVDGHVVLHQPLVTNYTVFHALVNETAGSHTLSVNLAGSSLPPDRWHSYQPWEVRLLPWTTEEIMLGYNVYFQ